MPYATEIIYMNKTCPKCNLPNPAQAAYCHNCASPLGAGPTVGAQQQQGWPQNPVGGAVAGGQAYVAAPQESQKAMISMILAIAGFLCCGPILGLPAAILGWMELDAIKNGRSSPSNKTMATVGLWGGILATVGHIIFYVIWFFLGLIGSAGTY